MGRLAIVADVLRAIVTACLLLILSAAWAGTFAALTITPHGPQQLDIVTGVTTLPDGGEVVVAELELTLSARYIRYLDGEFIETREAELAGPFGRLVAEQLYVDLLQQRITASVANLETDDGLALQAGELILDLESQIAHFSGGVSGTAPAFEAAELWVALRERQALLVSPYRYQDGPLTLQQPAPGALLQLVQQAGEGPPSFDASTAVDQKLLALFAPYLLQ